LIYLGSASADYLPPPYNLPGWVCYYGRTALLARGVYDLRGSLKYLANQHGGISHCSYVRGSFQASFSRAVRSLLRRGELQALSMVPIADYQPDRRFDEPWCSGPIHHLADGVYLMVDGQRFSTRRTPVRFVTHPGTPVECKTFSPRLP
jgi:hypothetical protein